MDGRGANSAATLAPLRPLLPGVLTFLVGSAVNAVIPSGTTGVLIYLGLASLVAVVGYWHPLSETKLSLAWTIAAAGLSIFLAYSTVVYLRSQGFVTLTSRAELLATYVRGETFRLADIGYGDAIVFRNRTFEDCDIFGPGMIFLTGEHSVLTENTITVPDEPQNDPNRQTLRMDMMLLAVSQPQTIYGAIVCENCTFRRNRLRGVQFIVSPEQKERLLRKG